MMLSEKTLKSWRIDFGEKVTSSAEAILKVMSGLCFWNYRYVQYGKRTEIMSALIIIAF